MRGAKPERDDLFVCANNCLVRYVVVGRYAKCQHRTRHIVAPYIANDIDIAIARVCCATVPPSGSSRVLRNGVFFGRGHQKNFFGRSKEVDLILGDVVHRADRQFPLGRTGAPVSRSTLLCTLGAIPAAEEAAGLARRVRTLRPRRACKRLLIKYYRSGQCGTKSKNFQNPPRRTKILPHTHNNRAARLDRNTTINPHLCLLLLPEPPQWYWWRCGPPFLPSNPIRSSCVNLQLFSLVLYHRSVLDCAWSQPFVRNLIDLIQQDHKK